MTPADRPAARAPQPSSQPLKPSSNACHGSTARATDEVALIRWASLGFALPLDSLAHAVPRSARHAIQTGVANVRIMIDLPSRESDPRAPSRRDTVQARARV